MLFGGSLVLGTSSIVLRTLIFHVRHRGKLMFFTLVLLEFSSRTLFKEARSRNFRQFQHWSSGHRINWNNKITAQNYRRTQTKHRKAKKGQGWTKLGRIEMDCIWVNLKNVGPPFFKFLSVYIKMSFKQLENHSQLLCGRDFENERLLLGQFDV